MRALDIEEVVIKSPANTGVQTRCATGARRAWQAEVKAGQAKAPPRWRSDAALSNNNLGGSSLSPAYSELIMQDRLAR